MQYIHGMIAFYIRLGFGIVYEYFRLFNTKPGICYLCPMIKMVFFLNPNTVMTFL